MADFNKYSRNVVDADLLKTRALPSNGTTVYSDSIDLEFNREDGVFLAEADVIVNAPAVTTTQLPDAKTFTYKLQESDDDSTFTDVATLGTQTGAGGAGADAKDFIGSIGSTTGRYIRLAILNSGTGNASTVNASFKLAF